MWLWRGSSVMWFWHPGAGSRSRCCFGWSGHLGPRRLGQGNSSMARWFLVAIQVIWVILLLLRGQPVLAASLAILALGERIAQPPLRGHLAWLLSMALLALGLGTGIRLCFGSGCSWWPFCFWEQLSTGFSYHRRHLSGFPGGDTAL